MKIYRQCREGQRSQIIIEPETDEQDDLIVDVLKVVADLQTLSRFKIDFFTDAVLDKNVMRFFEKAYVDGDNAKAATDTLEPLE